MSTEKILWGSYDGKDCYLVTLKNKNMTAPYQPPELEIIEFEIGDVITTSGTLEDNPFVPDDNVDDDW